MFIIPSQVISLTDKGIQILDMKLQSCDFGTY
jgi:hypothetical protein